METLKTAMETGVPHRPVAAAIARELIEQVGYFGRILVHSLLPRVLEHWPGELASGEQWRQLCSVNGGGCMVGRNLRIGYPLRISRYRQHPDRQAHHDSPHSRSLTHFHF